MLKIAICDDDRFVCDAMTQMLREYEASALDVEVFSTGEDLLSFIEEEHPFDLIFLDIELGTTTGVEVGRVIRNGYQDFVSKIVFVSATTGYDRQLFSVQPFGFIEKPVSAVVVQHYISLALQILGLDRRIFSYKKGTELYRIALGDILYFESQLRKIKIVTTTGVDYFRDSLSAVQSQLPSSFFSPHGSFLVNFSQVKVISKDSITMNDGAVVPISQRNTKQVRAMQIQAAKERRDAKL